MRIAGTGQYPRLDLVGDLSSASAEHSGAVSYGIAAAHYLQAYGRSGRGSAIDES